MANSQPPPPPRVVKPSFRNSLPQAFENGSGQKGKGDGSTAHIDGTLMKRDPMGEVR